MKYLTNYISFIFGIIASLKLPKFLRPVIYKVYSKLFGVPNQTITLPLVEYPSLSDFFVREIPIEQRKIESNFVFPVDGILRDSLIIVSDQQVQVKGVNYSLSKLISKQLNYQDYLNGLLLNFYLSPKDIHHIYAPCSGLVTRIIYLPGVLWPVNNFTYNRIPNLFARNERIILEIKVNSGKILLILIGAFNVGKISLTFSKIQTNSKFFCKSQDAYFTEECEYHFKIGEKLGTFHFGSSVVLIADQFCLQTFNNNVKLPSNSQVFFGQSIY